MRPNTKIAIAVDQNPAQKDNYSIWYVEVSSTGRVKHVGSVTKEQLVENLFKQYHLNGSSNWRVFRKEQDRSTQINLTDFMGMNIHENTHFGNLPDLSEFQKTLEALKCNLEIKKVA